MNHWGLFQDDISRISQEADALSISFVHSGCHSLEFR